MPERNNDADMDNLIRRSTHVEIPTEVEDRLRRRLMEFRTKVETQQPSRLRALLDSLLYLPAVRVTAMAAVLVVAVAVGLVLIPTQSRASQVFAAAAAQLRNSQSLEYTIVLNATPYVGVDLSFLAPAYRRINCSWGIEVRTDGATGKQIVLMHATRSYLTEGGKQVESQASTEDFAAQLRSLPQKADEVIGERAFDGKKLIGYRLHTAPPNGSIPGLKQLDIWINPETREADHADITVQEQGKPEHQMHIQNIRVGATVQRSLFDLTPPAGYSPIAIPGGESHANVPDLSGATLTLQARITRGAAQTAVVVPMQGSYAQTRVALQAVEAYLKTINVLPDGPAFGRFESEQNWEAGYPVPPGTSVKEPFKLITLPATLTASAVVHDVWAKDSTPRWAAFLKSTMEQGYVPAGPAMEIWSGEDAKPETQSTEMRMAVKKAN